MEFEIAVPPLINKLRRLLADDVITIQESRDKVRRLIDMLETLLHIPEYIEDGALPFPRLRTVILQDVNTAEDIVDALTLRAEVQRRKLSNQFRSNQLNSTDQLDSIISHLHKLLQIFRELLNRRLSHRIVLTGDAKQWENNIPGYLDEGSCFVGLENEIDHLVKRLLGYEDTTRNFGGVIPVVGVAGSGKTTLVRKIYNRVDIKKQFDCRAWVHVSSVDSKQRNNLLAKEKEEERNLLADIVKQVMVMTKEQTLSNEELKFRLSTFLEKKRYLIVLDGVCTMDVLHVWDSLRQALPADTENGSRMILTTVDADVAQQADPEGSPFQLRLLTDEESWALFLNKVNVSEDDLNTPDFIHLREQILRKCNGIPFAILLLGGLLSTINLSQWSRVIGHATFGESQSVSDILALSYRGLQSELKSCVLYMCLFPRGYEIPLRRLFGLWLSENMLTASRTEEMVAEDLFETYFNELVGRNMIKIAKWRSDGRPKACRMPGIIYDFLLPKALDMRFLYVYGNDPIDLKVKRCANYLDIEKYPANIESLRSYVSSDIRQRGIPALGIGMLLIQLTGKTSFGLLTVLDLEGVYKPVLPKELWKLLLLRYLGLRSTVLDSLPASVGELQCLETLDVKHTNITNLPSSILKGKKLRHLYLNGINLDMSIVQQSGGSVGDLQTLSGISIESEGSIKNGLDRFTGLRKLVLTCHSTAMEAVVGWISQLNNIRSLKLRSVDTFGQPSTLEWKPMKEHHKLSHLYLLGVLPRQANLGELLPQNLKIFTLSLSKLVDDPMPILGELRHLKTLRLLAQSYLGKQMNCFRGSFPQLRLLKVWMLEELEEWRMEEGAVPCLRELEIRRCKKLNPPYELQRFATLKELILTDMPENFVADIKRSMRAGDVFININNWEFSPSPYVSSLAFTKKKKKKKKKMIMEVIPRQFRKVWKKWDLRIFVLFSLTLQIILVILGSRRKYIPRAWIRITVWSAYLVADCIAIFGIGTLSNDLAEIYDDDGSINAKVELTAFWAPFLLLHLGGPDTITAYALEDNNLWLRHFLGLAVQTGGTIYIFLMIWTGSHLSFLSIMMILAGFIKYGERVWVLRQASYEQRRDSPPDPGLNYSKLMEEYHLKMAEGYHVMADEVIEVKGAVDLSLSGIDGIPNKEIILIPKAYGLLQRFKGLFADLLLRDVDRDTSRFIFTDMSPEDSFKFVEIELGFMYDLLYTKAAIVCSPWGCTCRIISLSLTFSVLGVFSLTGTHKYDKVDLAITFILLSVAVLLELYAILLQLSSDRAIVWLCMRNIRNNIFSIILPAITSLQRFKRTRWSDSMAQFSLLSFSHVNQCPTICSRILKLIDQKLEKQLLVTSEKISPNLKESIFKHVKEKLYEESSGNADLKSLCTYRGGNILKKFNLVESLGWSTNLEFDRSILIWHIATELCYYKDIQAEAEPKAEPEAEVEAEPKPEPEPESEPEVEVESETEAEPKPEVESEPEVEVESETESLASASEPEVEVKAEAKAETKTEAKAKAEGEAEAKAEVKRIREMSKHISQYMLSLLVIYPSMLPTGIGQFRFRDTSTEVMNSFAKQKSKSGKTQVIQAPGESVDSKSSQQSGKHTYLPTWLAPWAMNTFGIRKHMPDISKACNKLLEEKLQLPAFIAEGDRSKSVLFDACKLASQLQNISDTNEKWKMIREVWLEMLTYAASQCSGNNHAQQLRRGGELLTHVWLLMAHLGISEQFQMSEGHVIAKLIVR